MHTLIEDFLVINGRRIHCKVMSPAPNPANRPYLLCIQGGPGFSSYSMEAAMLELEKEAKAAGRELPNLIFFDPVGCGLSDKAEDAAAEYTMQNYSDIACQVVEQVKARLSPQQTMDLRLYGGSFGGAAVMDLPKHRPEWLEEHSKIRLRQIISNVAANGAGGREYSFKFIEDHYHDHPEYEQIKSELTKLYDGQIADHADYLRFVFALAPLYSDKLEKIRNSAFGKMLVNYPNQTIAVLKSMNKVLGNQTLAFMIEGLTGCSIEVLNTFFASNMSGFDMVKQVEDHRELYAKLPICMIACTMDHMIDPDTSRRVKALLPATSAAILLKDKHQARGGAGHEVFQKILLGLICEGQIPQSALEHDVIEEAYVPAEFAVKLQGLASRLPEFDSTSHALNVLSRRCGRPVNWKSVTNDDIEMVEMPAVPFMDVNPQHVEEKGEEDSRQLRFA